MQLKLVENQLSFVYTFKHFERVRLENKVFFEAKKKKNYTRSKYIKKIKIATNAKSIHLLKVKIKRILVRKTNYNLNKSSEKNHNVRTGTH